MLKEIRGFFSGEQGIDKATLGAIYARVGTFLGFYSLTVYLVTQGGIGLGIQPGLDMKAKITSAYSAIFVIGFGLAAIAIVGAAYTRAYRYHNELPLPLPWPAGQSLGRKGPIGWTIMLFGVFWCIAGPALVLYHVNKKVQNEGYLWIESELPSTVLEPACVYGHLLPFHSCSMAHNEQLYAAKVRAPSNTVWLTNSRCDALWWKTSGEPTTEAREKVSSSCKRPTDGNAADRSDLCKADQSKCRGSNWFQILGVPLTLLPDLMACFAILLLLVAWYWGPRITEDGD